MLGAKTKTYLPASLTLVRLFACVHTLMDSESRALDELFSAALKVTHMRTNAAMDSFCQKSQRRSDKKRSRAAYRGERGRCVSRNLFHTCCTDTPWVPVETGRVRGGPVPETCRGVACCAPYWGGETANWGPCWHSGPGLAGHPWRLEMGTRCSWDPSTGNAPIRGASLGDP